MVPASRALAVPSAVFHLDDWHIPVGVGERSACDFIRYSSCDGEELASRGIAAALAAYSLQTRGARSFLGRGRRVNDDWKESGKRSVEQRRESRYSG